MTFDQHIMMDSFIQNICKAAHYHLRNIGSVRDLLPEKAAAQLVHSLVTSRIDYCNSLLNGVPEYKTDRLHYGNHNHLIINNIRAKFISFICTY